jgi:hypothetical protein
MSNEIWKSVVGYEGFYEVSSLGRVRSLDRTIKLYNGGSYVRKEKTLVQIKDKRGYLKLKLLKNGKMKTFFVHRLVAQAFISNPNELPQVNHKDENKLNNKVENLEWCTQQYNIRYGTARERARYNLMVAVNQYDLDGNYIKTWNGMRDIERILGLKNQGVSLCCLKKRKMCGNFQWRYYEEEKECKKISKYVRPY